MIIKWDLKKINECENYEILAIMVEQCNGDKNYGTTTSVTRYLFDKKNKIFFDTHNSFVTSAIFNINVDSERIKSFINDTPLFYDTDERYSDESYNAKIKFFEISKILKLKYEKISHNSANNTYQYINLNKNLIKMEIKPQISILKATKMIEQNIFSFLYSSSCRYIKFSVL